MSSVKAFSPIPIFATVTPSEPAPKLVPAEIELIVASTSLIDPTDKVPSISAFPDISREPESNSPVKVIFLNPAMSKFASAIKAFEATAVPATEPSSRFSSAVVEVTPSKILISSADAVKAVPLSDTVPSMFTASRLEVPSTSRSPSKSALPIKDRVDAICTAPSISTASRLVVPSTSRLPLKSALPSR